MAEHATFVVEPDPYQEEEANMNPRTLTNLVAVAALPLLSACHNTQKIAPDSAGQRNDTCQASNDCGSGLSCIDYRCQPTEFKLDPTAKECSRFECDATADCCGDRPTVAPAKCDNRESICSTPSIAGCGFNDTCSDDAMCNGGTCASRTCGLDAASCSADTDCAANICNTVSDTCSVTGSPCALDSDCPENTCGTGLCDCANPEYNPGSAICSDPDCTDLCDRICDTDTNLCVVDTSCNTDNECFNVGLDICTAEGVCVECESNADCDEADGETCNSAGRCERACQFDQECDPFEVCDAGECVFEGCKSDLDCVLYANFGDADRRLAKCVTGPENIGQCRLPCDNDGHCGELQVCADGYCEFVGCETNAQCDRLLGLQNQQITDRRPYVTVGICEAPAP